MAFGRYRSETIIFGPCVFLLGRFHWIIPEIGTFSSEFSNSCFHLIICTRRVRVPDFVRFQSVHFNFLVSKRCGDLLGSWKLKMAKPKIEGTPTVGSISTQRVLYRGDFLVPIYHHPVPRGKWWMGTIETFLVYQNIFGFVVFSRPWCDMLFETCSVRCLTTPVIYQKPTPQMIWPNY